MPDNTTHPRHTHVPRLLGPAALALALLACAPSTFSQGRKPTVEDQSETSAARTQGGASAQGQTDSPRGVRARRVNTSQPSPSSVGTEASDARPSPTPAAAPQDAATNTTAAKEVSTKDEAPKDAASKESSAKETLTKEAATKEDASLKDAPVVKDSDSAAPKAGTAGGVEAELEELRARALAAQTDVERARLQRALADRLAELNRTQDAVTVLRALMREDRFDPVGLYNVGNALARLDDAQAAAEAYRKAVAQKNGHYSRALNNLGVVLIRLGHWDEAAAALASALREENGNYAEASFNLGRLHALRGEQDAASNEWLRALALDPGHAGAAVALARAYADGGDPERALKLLDNFAARLASRNASAPREVEVARGEIVAARNLSPEVRGGQLSADERGASVGPRVSDRLASSSTREVNLAPAANNAAALLPSAPAVAAPERPGGLTLGQQSYDLLQRARAARGAGRHEESVALYRRMLALQGGYFAPANLELGYALNSLQRTDEAIAALTQVAAREGARYPVVFYHLGRLYERTNRLPLAAEAFTRAAQLYGDNNPQMLLDVSRVREKEGNTAAALAAMEAYTRSLERNGSVPEWATARLAQLRQKAAPPAASPKQ